VFNAVCAIDADDGVRYDTATMKMSPIREDNLYGGTRLSLLAFVGSARLPVQVDIGFGDAITPAPEIVTYPTLLEGMDAPRLRAYPVYTVIAEKFHAMVELGINNSRMKDFFDLAVIVRTSALEGGILVKAIRATFARRGTVLPATTPIALSREFAVDPGKVRQWSAFVNKGHLLAHDLGEVVALLNALLEPPSRAAVGDEPFELRWAPSAQAWR
jgi:Nucleotidyl transferase AbiEii toxin, Type IV TA system